MDLFLTNMQVCFTRCKLMDWSIVDYCDVFLSAVWTLILTAPIHCRGSIGEQVMLNFSRSVLMKKQTFNGLRVSTFSANFCFWTTYFNCLSICTLIHFHCINLCLSEYDKVERLKGKKFTENVENDILIAWNVIQHLSNQITVKSVTLMNLNDLEYRFLKWQIKMLYKKV